MVARSSKAINVQTRDMIDSSALYRGQCWQQLRRRLAEDGYLLIRGLNSRPACLQVYEFLCKALNESQPDKVDPDGMLKEAAGSIGLLQRQDLASNKLVLQQLETEHLLSLMKGLLQVDHLVTTNFKWLRAVARGEHTGVHTDRVYLGEGSQRLLTAWLPLGDTPRQQGAVMVCRSSHRKRAFARIQQRYGTSSAGRDGTRSGWLASQAQDLPALVGNPYAVDWRTADLLAGDVVVLSLGVIHMTAPNDTDRVRISCDTRWLPADDVRDPRAGSWHAVPRTSINSPDACYF